MIRRIASRLARTSYVRAALADEIDLRELRIRPTARLISGLCLVGLSYIVGWPAVGVLAVLAIYMGEPWIVAIGGPVTYGFSYVIFFAGAWLAGAEHARILTKYVTKRLFRKILNAKEAES